MVDCCQEVHWITGLNDCCKLVFLVCKIDEIVIWRNEEENGKCENRPQLKGVTCLIYLKILRSFRV